MSTKRAPAPKASKRNPFDSDSDDEKDRKPSRPSSVPPVTEANTSGNGGTVTSSSSYYGISSARSRYRNDFRDSGGIENQSMQELEGYATYKAEETTDSVNNCLKIAEEMRDTASKTLVTLNQQGEQIERSHLKAVDIDQDLRRGEKLLGDLGGLFSKKWRPNARKVKGPMLTRDDSFIRKGSHTEQKQKLGITDRAPRSNPRQALTEPLSTLEKVEFEKQKQDDALSNLSNILTELKGMAIDMGAEVERQTHSLQHMDEDVEELNYGLKGATARTRRLVGK